MSAIAVHLARIYVLEDTDTPTTISNHLSTRGLDALAFNNPEALLQQIDPHAPTCLILNPSDNHPDAPAMLSHMAKLGIDVPTILIVPNDAVPNAVSAMRAGAADVLQRSSTSNALLESINTAIEAHANRLTHLTEVQSVLQRRARLSPRERDVLKLVVDGNSTKQIAEMLCRTEKTIEFHRRNIMHKMEASNVASLVRMVVTLPEPAAP